LGETRPPLNLPIRHLEGALMKVEIYAQMVAAGERRKEARRAAGALAADVRWLVELVENTATRVRVTLG
jgi:hypothetical protein